MAADLIPGFTHVRRGTARYRGVLRRTASAAPAWTCPCPVVHLTPGEARRCAEAEAARRRRGGREVFALLHCGPCRRWWEDEPPSPHGPYACPRCSVPLERVKVAVIERGPAT